MTNPQLADMHKRAERLSNSRDELARLFQHLQVDLDQVKRHHMPAVKSVARRIAKEQAELHALIESSPDQFTRPRSQVVEGIKFGYQLVAGKLTWEDDARVCARIRALAAAGDLPEDQVALLISITEAPSAAALRALDEKLLKRMGVTLEGAGDRAFIKSVDSSIEKAVNAVINAAIKEAQASED
ncbi:hypothetical protein [Pseudacidovorax intermedius]|uniref:hypothetical protein n=1 Tax=Pseudacidovorax intermedius TaxID=433924 RepID=UPI0026F2C1C5|nr:hypothetical protein [Pseudacidovorax intermedius]